MSDDSTTLILSAIADLRTDTNGLRSNVERLEINLGGLRSNVERLEINLDGLRSSVDRLRGDSMARMDRLQNAITSFQDDITVNFGRSDRVEKVARGTSEELRALGTEVSAMERQIQHLQAQVRALRGEG